MAPGFYISKEGAKALRNDYKYVSSDKSLLTKLFLGDYWNWAVKFVPLWMAPNVVTVLGLCSLIPSIILTFIYCPTFTEAQPGWLHVLSGFGIFSYATLDALDGKQARRTGTSGPLGELFDHGCDSIAIGIIGIRILAILRLGLDGTVLLIFVLGMAAFFLATWEYYLTGHMIFRQINPVVEGMHFVVLVEIFMSIVGTEFLMINISAYLPASLIVYTGDILVMNALKNLALFAICSQIMNSFLAVVWIRSPDSRPVDSTHAIAVLVPVFSVTLISAVWVIVSPVFSNAAMMKYWLFATLLHFAWHSDTTVLCAVSKMPLNPLRFRMWIGVVCPFLGVLTHYLGVTAVDEEWYVIAYLGFSIMFHLHMVVSTVSDLAEILDINVFTVKQKVAGIAHRTRSRKDN